MRTPWPARMSVTRLSPTIDKSAPVVLVVERPGDARDGCAANLVGSLRRARVVDHALWVGEGRADERNVGSVGRPGWTRGPFGQGADLHRLAAGHVEHK